MLNTLAIVGRVACLPEVTRLGNGFSESYMAIEVDDPYLNKDGSRSQSVFEVKLWQGIAKDCLDVLEVGDVVSIKGRLSSRQVLVEDTWMDKMYVVGETVRFIAKEEEIVS